MTCVTLVNEAQPSTIECPCFHSPINARSDAAHRARQKPEVGFSYGFLKGAAAGDEADVELGQRVMVLETKASLQAADRGHTASTGASAADRDALVVG